MMIWFNVGTALLMALVMLGFIARGAIQSMARRWERIPVRCDEERPLRLMGRTFDDTRDSRY